VCVTTPRILQRSSLQRGWNQTLFPIRFRGRLADAKHCTKQTGHLNSTGKQRLFLFRNYASRQDVVQKWIRPLSFDHSMTWLFFLKRWNSPKATSLLKNIGQHQFLSVQNEEQVLLVNDRFSLYQRFLRCFLQPWIVVLVLLMLNRFLYVWAQSHGLASWSHVFEDQNLFFSFPHRFLFFTRHFWLHWPHSAVQSGCSSRLRQKHYFTSCAGEAVIVKRKHLRGQLSYIYSMSLGLTLAASGKTVLTHEKFCSEATCGFVVCPNEVSQRRISFLVAECGMQLNECRSMLN